MSQPILKESKCITSSILTQQQQNFPFLLPQNRLRFNTQTAATLMSGLINPRLYFENLAAEARNKFGIENNFRLKTSINLDNIFHRSVSGASTYQMTTLNETIRNEQQKINSQMNNFSKLLIPSYCSTTFPSPSQFIPIQSFPSISSWQTLFKNNNAKNLQEQETKFKENPLYMLQPPSITHKSNENSLTAHAEGEDVINERLVFLKYKFLN
ncbi:unnamed protein product [Meloidogyne enterolobii]|uniref:Uncharacterized protein n=1 Tax=Meloidogyne enterolobii TaxID=390850 RepID=A0ACB1AJ63_MELEN